MNINDCFTANTPGECSLGESVGKDVRAALGALLVCGNKIDQWGLGKWLFLTLGYANWTLVCVYCDGALRHFLGAAQIWGQTTARRTKDGRRKDLCACSKWVYQFGNQCWNSSFMFPRRQIQWYSIKSNRNAMHFKSGRHTKKCLSMCECEEKQWEGIESTQEQKEQTCRKPQTHKISCSTCTHTHAHAL